jgi:hypothetical protein
MQKTKENLFWPGFADLMTSLFFIMLVLYVLTFFLLRQQQQELKIKVKDLQEKLNVYDLVEKNLQPLKKDASGLFRYEEKYKRFVLAFDVNFEIGSSDISEQGLVNPWQTLNNINKAGDRLRQLVDSLRQAQDDHPEIKKVSYLLIISGSASHLNIGTEQHDYELSYRRAFALWSYWKARGINFEQPKYQDLVDLQIAGNGWGGIGRFPRDDYNGFWKERKNQRFIIQVVPKIGDAK